MMSMNRMRKAQLRIAVGKPTFGIKCTAINGKTMPPSEDPAIVRPPAMARFFLKYVIGWYNS